MQDALEEVALDVDHAGELSMLKRAALQVLTELSSPRDVD